MKWERARVKEQTLDPLWLSPLHFWARRGFKVDEGKDTRWFKSKPFPCERCTANDSKNHGLGFCVSVFFQTKVQDPDKCLGCSFFRLLSSYYFRAIWETWSVGVSSGVWRYTLFGMGFNQSDCIHIRSSTHIWSFSVPTNLVTRGVYRSRKNKTSLL